MRNGLIGRVKKSKSAYSVRTNSIAQRICVSIDSLYRDSLCLRTMSQGGNRIAYVDIYISLTQKNYTYFSGFRYSLRTATRDDIEDAILAANTDPDVDGIIVYYPIFNNRQDQYLQQIVDISKDVEGLSHRYIFNMYQNIRYLDPAPGPQRQKSILPCTPLAVIKILEYLHIYNTILPYGNRLFGHTICVVNRSEVVGRPLAALLANDGACVYSVDITGVQQFTRGEGLKKRRHEVVDMENWKLEDAVPHCDVVITGVPGDKFKFNTKLLRQGAVCINFSSEKVRQRGRKFFFLFSSSEIYKSIISQLHEICMC